MYWSVPPLWQDATVVVMGSGPSLNAEDAAAVKHLPRIVTNATYRMAPDADVIYGSDCEFWIHDAYKDVAQCGGLKVTTERMPGIRPNTPPFVKVLRNGGPIGYSDDPGEIRTGASSGYAAVHLAALGGAKRILLLGLDMTGGHWHGPHPSGLGNPGPSLHSRWIKFFNGLADALGRRKVEVLNCSPVSALDCFQKVRLCDAL